MRTVEQLKKMKTLLEGYNEYRKASNGLVKIKKIGFYKHPEYNDSILFFADIEVERDNYPEKEFALVVVDKSGDSVDLEPKMLYAQAEELIKTCEPIKNLKQI